MLPASPETVYDMLTDPVRHAQFTRSPASGSSLLGGILTTHGGYILAQNLELERGKHIVQEWSTTEWPEGLPPSRLEIKLHAIGRGTDLSMVQTGVPAADVERYAQGWYEYYWNPLFEYLREISTRSKVRERIEKEKICPLERSGEGFRIRSGRPPSTPCS